MVTNPDPALAGICPHCGQALNEGGIDIAGERWHERCAAAWVVQSAHAEVSGHAQPRGRARRTLDLMDAVVEGSPQIVELFAHGLWHALKMAVRAAIQLLLPW